MFFFSFISCVQDDYKTFLNVLYASKFAFHTMIASKIFKSFFVANQNTKRHVEPCRRFLVTN